MDFVTLLPFRKNQKQDHFLGSWRSGNENYLLFVYSKDLPNCSLYFKDILDSITFYRVMFLHAYPIQSVYPKCHFMFLINWKTKFKILYLDFVFNLKSKFKYLTAIFLFKRVLFEFLIASFAFHFHKKMENEIQFIFRFSFSEGIEKRIT